MTSTPYSNHQNIVESANKLLVEKFAHYLKGQLHNPETVFKWMKKYNVHLAGGVVLKFLNGEEIGNSDLDFYDFEDMSKYKNINEYMIYHDIMRTITENEYSESFTFDQAKTRFTIENFLANGGDKYFKQFGDKFVPYSSVREHGSFACELYFCSDGIYKGMTVTPDEAYEEGARISSITDYAYIPGNLCEEHINTKCMTGSEYINCCGKGHIQIMQPTDKHKTMTDYMRKTFDFDFCKVSFDGETFTILHPDAVTKKTCVYKTSHKNKKLSEARRKKYEDRGYKFT